ncbi:MAG: AmmeMemoRadiSam system protein B [Ardenticatenia bacterium]|jgi:AmmeMemoRadiSam system protein B|nr:MAG: AmmeMemoRadiSam system protein B [Ardenticatenia bacterium]
MTNTMKPKLRVVDVRPFHDGGRPLLLLRDPLRLSDLTVVMPQALAPLLAMLDGSREVDELHAALLVRTGLDVPREIIHQLLEHLDNALLLDNERYAHSYQQAVQRYRTAPARDMALAGDGYPAEPDALRRLLDGYLAAAGQDGTSTVTGGTVVGLISPHIDYQRGGPTYAQVWQAAAAAVRAAELVIIFGTDHNGHRSLITPTRQNYATPYGILPTAREVVDAVATAIGEEAAFCEEINHRGEHSIELAAVWLHHMRGGEPCALVPILCGSFHQFIEDRRSPAEDSTLNAALETLRTATAGRRTLVVAAADLAHVGPAFGDPFPVDYVRYLRLQAADEMLLQTVLRVDAEAFYQMVAHEGNQRNICGLPPIYMTLRMLAEGSVGVLTGYARCPADAQNTSFVSICGVVFHNVSMLG